MIYAYINVDCLFLITTLVQIIRDLRGDKLKNKGMKGIVVGAALAASSVSNAGIISIVDAEGTSTFISGGIVFDISLTDFIATEDVFLGLTVRGDFDSNLENLTLSLSGIPGIDLLFDGNNGNNGGWVTNLSDGGGDYSITAFGDSNATSVVSANDWNAFFRQRTMTATASSNVNADPIYSAPFHEVYYSLEISSESNMQVPEPSSITIFALGMIGLASRRFKKQS